MVLARSPGGTRAWAWSVGPLATSAGGLHPTGRGRLGSMSRSTATPTRTTAPVPVSPSAPGRPAPHPITRTDLRGAEPVRPRTGSPERTGRSTFGTPPSPASAPTLLDPVSWQQRLANRPSVWLSILAGLACTAAVATRQLFLARSVPAPATRSEAWLSADAFSLNSVGEHVVTSSLSPAVTGRLLSIYNALTAAPARYDTLSEATREFLVVVTALGALAAFGLCRRLQLGIVASSAAVLVAGLPTLAATTRIVAWNETIATTLILSAAALLAVSTTVARAWRWVSGAGALVFAVAAIIVSPVAGLIVVGVAMTMVGMLVGSDWRPADRLLFAAPALIALIGTVWLTVIEPTGASPTDGRLNTFAVGVGVIGIVVAALAFTTRWLRPLALAATPIILAPLWPGPAQGAAASMAMVPIAVLGAAYAAHLVPEARDQLRDLRHRARDAVVTMTALGAAVVLVVLPAAPVEAAADPAGAPYDDVAAWVTTQVPTSTKVEVSALFRAELLRRGVMGDQLVLGPAPTSATLLLSVRPIAQSPELPLLAQFGSGAGTVGIRLVLQNPAEYDAGMAAEAADRTLFGEALVDNPRVVFTATARADVLAGKVDSRVLLAISTASLQMRLTVVEFPRTDGDVPASGLLRTVVISDVTNVPPGSPVGGATDRLQLLLGAQQPPFSPMRVTVEATTVTVTYSAPSPIGVIDP